MKRRWTIPIFLMAVVLVPITVFALVSWYQTHYTSLPILSPKGKPIGAFSFADQQGNTLTEKDWKGKIVIANYFFTHCPVVCPKMTEQLRRVQAAANERVLLCSFSVDPERDSVGCLRHYAERWGIGNNWKLLTGEKKALYRFARKELQLVATDGDGGPTDFIHSERLVLLDGEGRIRGFYKGTDPSDVDQLIWDLKKLH